MARAREVPGFDCDERFERAAVRVIEVRAAEVFDHSGGVLDLEEIEPVHDMRVATRRLRAAMEVFEPCFPQEQYRQALRRLKALAGALGERRDRDVAIGFLAEFAVGVPAADQVRVEGLIAELRDEQRRANDELAPFVSEKRLAKLRGALDELLGTVGP